MQIPSILPDHWKTPDVFRQRLGVQVGRQRAMFADDHLLLVLHHPPQGEDTQRRGAFFWRNAEGDWLSNDFGSGPGALGKLLDSYADLIAKYDRIEQQSNSAQDYFEIMDAILPIQRAVRHLHAALQEARKLAPADRDLLNSRDRAYEIDRTTELLYSGCKNSLDYAVARQAEAHTATSHQMAVAAHRLNILAALFFPIAALTAIFGVNLEHGWENTLAPWPFLTVISIGLLMGIFLSLLIGAKVAPPAAKARKKAAGNPSRSNPRRP